MYVLPDILKARGPISAVVVIQVFRAEAPDGLVASVTDDRVLILLLPSVQFPLQVRFQRISAEEVDYCRNLQ